MVSFLMMNGFKFLKKPGPVETGLGVWD